METLTLCSSALISSTVPMAFSTLPLLIRTLSPGSRSMRIVPWQLVILSYSSSVSGIGSLPGPTKPVTPRVLRTTYQLSVVLIILTRT